MCECPPPYLGKYSHMQEVQLWLGNFNGHVKVQRQFSKGFSVIANYTYSKALASAQQGSNSTLNQRKNCLAWGIPEYNNFGNDEFLQLCGPVGAVPQFNLNMGSGTAEEAADWVRYIRAHHRGPRPLRDRQRTLRQVAVGLLPSTTSHHERSASASATRAIDPRAFTTASSRTRPTAFDLGRLHIARPAQVRQIKATVATNVTVRSSCNTSFLTSSLSSPSAGSRSSSQ